MSDITSESQSNSSSQRSKPKCRKNKVAAHAPFSRRTFRILSLNIEGHSTSKANLLCQLDADVFCLQEMDQSDQQKRPRIPGMVIVAEVPDQYHGTAIITKPAINIISALSEKINGIDVVQSVTEIFHIIRVYKPPTTPFNLPDIPAKPLHVLFLGDVNFHSPRWCGEFLEVRYVALLSCRSSQ